jgi:dihydroneopterin triphosphate diphosphatase
MTQEVLVIVRRGEKFLVLLRAPEEGAFWHTVAGTVEPGEEWHATAVRELEEETGLVVEEVHELGGFEYVREAWEDHPGMRVPVRTFVIDAPDGWEPVLNEEHDEYRWCTREEAAELLYWPEPREIVLSL